MEPWLSGRHADLDPVRRLLACSLDQALGDLQRWVPPEPAAGIASQLRHIAGSVDRLFTYALGGSLSELQLAVMGSETVAAGTREELMELVEATFAKVQAELRMMDDIDYREPRYVGRRQVEVPLGVLLGHIAEHTQRHIGQVIELAKAAAA